MSVPMFRLLVKIPRTINLAFSGGVDSLAVAHFLKRGGRNVTLLHFNHGCRYSDKIERECVGLASALGIPIKIGKTDSSNTPRKGQSLEDYWRRNRYQFLRSFGEQFITCHHLDDAIESSIMSLLNTGTATLIPVTDSLVMRPFLTTKKCQFVDYAKRNNLTPVEDAYNFDMTKQRNYIRHNIVPHILHTHPGYYKVLRKRYANINVDS